MAEQKQGGYTNRSEQKFYRGEHQWNLTCLGARQEEPSLLALFTSPAYTTTTVVLSRSPLLCYCLYCVTDVAFRQGQTYSAGSAQLSRTADRRAGMDR
jgi:hypothetical protein